MIKICFTFLLLFVVLYAHPHTFIDLYPKVAIKNKLIQKLHLDWLMDEMTSSMLIMEFDQNSDGYLDKDENKYIEENYFLTLKDYDFYMHLKYKYILKNFQASIVKNRIQYGFDLFFDKKIPIKNFSIDFYDTDFFVSMQLKKEFITQNIKYKIEDIDGDFYYGYKLMYK